MCIYRQRQRERESEREELNFSSTVPFRSAQSVRDQVHSLEIGTHISPYNSMNVLRNRCTEHEDLATETGGTKLNGSLRKQETA